MYIQNNSFYALPWILPINLYLKIIITANMRDYTKP